MLRSGACLGITPLLVLAGCASVHHTPASKGKIAVIAHRGASAYAPENTLASYAKAIELGADWFELDTQLTKDGQVICLHNSDLDKTTNAKGPVNNYTLEELKRLDAGSWFGKTFAGEPLPTFGEALDLAKGRIGVYAEFKNCTDENKQIRELMGRFQGIETLTPEMSDEAMRMLEASGDVNIELTRKCIAAIRERTMQQQVVIQSFSPIICFVAVREAPDMRVELLIDESDKDPSQWPTLVWFGNLIGVKGFNSNHEALTEERLAGFHNAGKTVAVWTVDDPAKMRRYAEWGVDAIITNKPDVCLTQLREMGCHQ